MTTAKLRWGILGVASINERVLPSFARAETADLRAIASRSPDRARAAAIEAGIPTAYGSYDDLLRDPDIDAVYLPLPNTLHVEWTRKAAQHGKHVLCEKPLAPTAAEAQELVAFCKGQGVQLMDGFMWPHHPRTVHLHHFLHDGGVGEVRRVTGSFTFPLPLDADNIRLNPETAGGSLLDVGCYPVYGIRWAFAAEPVRVQAWARYHRADGVDLEMTGVLFLADGRAGVFDCGFTLPLRGWLEVVGTTGTVFVPDLWLPGTRATYQVRREGRPLEEVAIEGHDQVAHMLDDFGRAVRDGVPVEPAPAEAVRTLRVLDALARSAREGRAVAV
jgi:D-xylose 1-dehydrogenase (NADP+, D-xylono-1,5-lactone-forming)